MRRHVTVPWCIQDFDTPGLYRTYGAHPPCHCTFVPSNARRRTTSTWLTQRQPALPLKPGLAVNPVETRTTTSPSIRSVEASGRLGDQNHLTPFMEVDASLSLAPLWVVKFPAACLAASWLRRSPDALLGVGYLGQGLRRACLTAVEDPG